MQSLPSPSEYGDSEATGAVSDRADTVAQLLQENASLKQALAAATARNEALALELQQSRHDFERATDEHQSDRASLKALLETVTRQKADLEVLVQTLMEHGDSLDAQWNEKFSETARQSGIDSLTQLANRRQFDEYYGSQWTRLVRENAPLAVIMLDIDAFKGYNDTYGHLAGDACLKQVAGAFGQCLQHPADLAARYGGEEFIAFLPHTNLAEATLVAERIREAIATLAIPHASSPAAPHVTASIGVASIIPTATTPTDRPIRLADEHLYKAKNSGRNRIVSPSIGESQQ